MIDWAQYLLEPDKFPRPIKAQNSVSNGLDFFFLIEG